MHQKANYFCINPDCLFIDISMRNLNKNSIKHGPMKYIFPTLIGIFVFDNNFHLVESLPFNSISQYQKREELIQKLRQKYKDAVFPEGDKLGQALSFLRKKEYFPLFYGQHVQLTRKGIRESISEDNFILQAIASIEELDKTANLFSRRMREWCGLYAPEIAEKIPSDEKLCEALLTKKREWLYKEMKLPSEESMGGALQKEDVAALLSLIEQLSQLHTLRKKHEAYLESIMKKHCRNVQAMCGTTIGAKLLEHAGGLKGLAMLPAGTIQLFGAEKALFRHIKSGARAPKYGLLFQHPFVQQVKKELRGKAARALAEKISLAARLDYFKGEFKAEQMKKELGEKFA